MMWRAALLLTAVVGLASAEKVRYDGYRVYRVLPANQEQLQFVAGLETQHRDILFWKEARTVNRTADMMVSPRMQAVFLDSLQARGMKASVYVDNVQKLIDSERPAARQKAAFAWEDYHSLEEIHAWLDTLPALYPNVVTSVVGGNSYEGRENRGVKISFGTGNPAVVIEGGIHAREWISVAAVTWILNEILTTNDTAVRTIVHKFDFYIFPNTNPDGYEYTWTTDRLWRRTRTPYLLCHGADANRNWDFHWREEGASILPCTEDYAGPEAFSEEETRTFSEFLTGLGDNLQVYLSFHSYSQYLMFPYGLSSVVAPNYDELLDIATRAAETLATRYGTQYTAGSIVDTVYPAAGSSVDWVAGALGKQYSFVWELRDAGVFGFLLPSDQIIPTSEETFDSIISILVDVLADTKRGAKRPQ